MRVSTRQALLITLAVIARVLTIALGITTAVLGLAALIHAIKPEETHNYPFLVPFWQSVEALPFDVVVAFEVFAAAWVLTGIASWLWHKAMDISADKPPSPEELARSRKELMATVRNVWIDNRLRNSIHNSVLMHPDTALSQEPVDNRLDLTVRSAIEQEHLLPDNERLIDVYDRAGGRLLVLGEPGSGKTTTMLQLTEQLLDRAKDPTEPFPVVFTLSSWQGQEFDHWLIGQLGAWYDIDKNTARWWLDERKIILMLDGLDEVQPETQQKACLQALNKFRAESHARVVLASRIKDYALLGAKMDAELALEVKPLSPEKIANYLVGLGVEGELLWSAFLKEPLLFALAQSPFLLNIMAMSAPDLASALTSERKGTLTEIVLDSFIKNRLRLRESLQIQYKPVDIALYLKFMATNIRKKSFGGVMLPEFVSMLYSESDRYGQWKRRWVPKFMIVLAVALVVFGLIVGGLVLVRILSSSTPDQIADSFSGDIGTGLIREAGKLLYLLGTASLCFAITLLTFKYLWFRKKRTLQRAGLELGMDVAWALLGLQVVATCVFLWLLIIYLGAEWDSVLTNKLSTVEYLGQAVLFAVLVVLPALAVANGYDAKLALWLQHFLPWNLKGFLRHCVKLKLMYRAGPGYVFIHRLLLDHFADLDIDRLRLEDLEKPRT